MKQEKFKNIYMIGIKGVGMTTLAQFLVASGHHVLGSDTAETFMTDNVLKKLKIKVKSPFKEENLPVQNDLVIYSIAYNAKNNIEMKALAERVGQGEKIKILSYSEALGEIVSSGRGIAVCGSHGKTTTSAWLGYVLWKSGKNPNVFVGSNVPQFQSNGLYGKSNIFVTEADEYGNKLQYIKPYGVLLNNIDYDHPDFFKTEADYLKAFIDFVKKIPKNGFLVVNNRDAYTKQIKRNCLSKIISYDLETIGQSRETVNYFAYDLKNKNNAQTFKVNNFGEFKIRLWGEHNVSNALAVIAAALELKVSLQNVKKYLGEFKGTERRLQYLGKYKGAMIIDDYAHHPTEIKATLRGVRGHYSAKNIITVFHPHTFTRTKALFNDFVKSFENTDELIVLDIYGSAREKQGGTSSKLLVQAISAYNSRNKINQNILNIKSIKEVSQYLKKKLTKNDLVLLMGAGDVFRVYDNL